MAKRSKKSKRPSNLIKAKDTQQRIVEAHLKDARVAKASGDWESSQTSALAAMAAAKDYPELESLALQARKFLGNKSR